MSKSNGNQHWDHVMKLRVRYRECDPQSVVHHSVYPVWLEMARTEALREAGFRYRDLEDQGVLIVVAKLNVRYHRPAMYDDLVEVAVRCDAKGPGKIEHVYQVMREGQKLVSAQTTLVCVGRDGNMLRVPDKVMKLLESGKS